MFPHNSSSHEISTETNAFVQNSKGDVVVLEESSLSGAREGERPEHARYCDIKFINSSMMAAPTSHPKATVANDFITVLPRQSGELSFAVGGEACQSVATETTKNSTNHLLTYDNNAKVNNHNNAEHNHHKYRKQNTPGSLDQLGSSADKSKSKPLSDNKDSSSDLSIRVLKLSVRIKNRMSDACRTVGVPSLDRIPKSDCPHRLPRLANIVDNYLLLGSRLDQGENNNIKANLSAISNNNSKSVILLSSNSYGDYCLLLVVAGGWLTDIISAIDIAVKFNKMKLLGDKRKIKVISVNNEATECQLLEGFLLMQKKWKKNLMTVKNWAVDLSVLSLQQQQQQQQQQKQQQQQEQQPPPSVKVKSTHIIISYAQNLTVQMPARSSITLIVSKNSIIDYTLQFFKHDYLSKERAIISLFQLWQVTMSKLTQRICVPLLIKSKDYDNVGINNDYCNNDTVDHYCNICEENINSNNNPDVIQDIVNVAVCYKTSCVITTDSRLLGSQNDGISRTEATIFTVGALSFQDKNKSNNKPLNDNFKNFKNFKYQVSAKVNLEFNYTNKLRSKSSNKSELSYKSYQTQLDISDDLECAVRSAINIPILTTCEPTMTLTSQSTTVTSQTTKSVPVISDYIYDQSNDQLITHCNNHCDSAWPLSCNWERLIAYVRALIPIYQQAYKNNDNQFESQRNELKKALRYFLNGIITYYCDPAADYKRRWGIPIFAKLIGGGESSLNSGAGTNWGSPQATTSNNNNNNNNSNNANASGWGATSGNAPPPSANWANNNVNRAVTGNSNQNPNQGPPGNPSNSAPANKTNNANQSTNSSSGPSTSQPSNVSQANQNTGAWPQGKSNNTSGPGPNPIAPNNNGNAVATTAAGTNGNNQSTNSAPGGVSTGTPSTTNPSTKQQLEQLNTMREALFSQDGWGCQHVNQETNWDVPASPEPAMPKDGVPMWKPPVNNGTDLWDANVRNGGQPPPPQQAKTPWGHTPSTNIGGTWGEDDEAADSSNMWTGAPTPTQPNTPQWPGGTSNPGASSWGDPRIDPRDPRDIRSVDPREMRDPRDHRMTIDPRDHMRVMDPLARDPRMADMRGDPRGISGRLNGANADAMWGQPPGPPHHQMAHQHPSGPPAKMLNPSSMNQWAPPPAKEMMPGKPSGWEEPSPPTQRRNVPNYDDGTSLWGNPAANQRPIASSKASHWKDLPTPSMGGRGGMQCPPGMPQNRMPGQPGMKPDVGPMWGHPGGPGGRNGSWGDGPHETGNWEDPKTPSWNEPPMNPASWGGPSAHKPKAMGPTGSWADDIDPTPPSWGHPSKPTLTKEVIWNSREFRYLCDMGYKKEDVEAALRNRDMNRDEAQELLSQIRTMDQWRRHDPPSGYDPSNQANMSAAYPKFSHVAQQMSFPPASRTPQNPPTTQQLRMLVQQIQLAVQEGYLNQQILNQPLAPSTLILLNQLLQQIKVLQQLIQQHSVQSSIKGNSQTTLQISVQITKTKQQISNLQNQIAVQQATYMKQHQQQHSAPSQSSDYYKTSVHDPMSALQNSFSDLAMNKEPPVSQQQSRLTQWKLPSLEKDGDLGGNEFSRAPGTTSKPPSSSVGLSHSHSSPNMNPLLGQGDGTWSTRLGDTGGWPDASNSDATDGKDWQPSGAAFSDLVPEFEPGKPWKMKSVEDDPSITPGSVVRSLSLAAIKDPDAIFSSTTKTSPPPQVQNVDTSIPSLSNSTWSFNPPSTTPSAFTSAKNSWADSAPPPTAVTSELWGAPMNKARQGPPPGLSSKNTVGNTSNGWAGLGAAVSRSTSSWGLHAGTVGGSNSGWLVGTWLLLKNLTPQIDGSTLKTLCMQHGPVQDFRLYLNHGIALTKYSSRDEASKAQGALNNCVLGNTTIFAESPADSEVHTLLQQLSHGGQQQTGASGGNAWGLRPSNKTGPPQDTWGGSSSQLWGAPPSSNSLWSNSGLDSETQRTTPSSLNSYLPGDLLGGESM